MPSYELYSEWKAWELNFKFSPNEALYFETEFGKIVSPGRRLVEIGFGNGGFLSWARQRGAEVYGVEIQDEMISRAREHGYTVVSDLNHLVPHRGEGFDVVIAVDVVEHIATEELRKFLVSVGELLKPTGTFVIRVPNGASPFGRHYQYGDATHVNVVTPSKISQLSLGSGLRISEIRNEARIVFGSFSHRIGQRLKYVMRDAVNKTLARLYNLPHDTLDSQLIIVLSPAIDGKAEAAAQQVSM